MEETHILFQKEKILAKEENRLTINDLLPKTVYSFSISAMFLDANTWSPPQRIELETWADGGKFYFSQFHLNLRKSLASLSTFADRFSSTSG